MKVLIRDSVVTYPPPAEHSPAFPVVDMTASAAAVRGTVTAYNNARADPTHPIYSSSQHSIMTTGMNGEIGMLCADAEYLSTDLNLGCILSYHWKIGKISNRPFKWNIN